MSFLFNNLVLLYVFYIYVCIYYIYVCVYIYIYIFTILYSLKSFIRMHKLCFGICQVKAFFSLIVCVLSRSVVSNSLRPKDYSLPGSSVHGILQARILE